MLLSIIIVSHNTKELLARSIASVMSQDMSKAEYEIIVVDNASTDGSVEHVQSAFPQVKLILNTNNVGYGQANNQGIAQSKGKWVLLLNSDTDLKEQVLKALLSEASSNEDSIYGIRLLNKDGTIQPSAGYFPTIGRVIAQMLFIDDIPLVKRFYKPYQQGDVSFYESRRDVDWVTGAFFLVPKKLIQSVGGFDESIFMYGEEVDLCFRLKQKGAQARFIPSYSVYHYKGASSVDGFTAAVTGEYKGLQVFYKKYYPDQIKLLRHVLKLGALLRFALFGMIRPARASAYKLAISALSP